MLRLVTWLGSLELWKIDPTRALSTIFGVGWAIGHPSRCHEVQNAPVLSVNVDTFSLHRWADLGGA